MNPIFLTLTTILAIAQLTLPTRLAFLPLLVAAFHLGDVEFLGQLTPSRLLIVLGIVRAIATGQFSFSFQNRIDLLFLLFCFFALLSAPFHNPPHFNPYSERIGLILNAFGCYLYGRAYLKPHENYRAFVACLAFVVTPLGISMVVEQVAHTNSYYNIGSARNPGVTMRDGDVRAKGPFAHAILGGTAGAVTAPLFLVLWRRRRKTAFLGLGSSLSIVASSNSSGPIAACAFSFAVVYAWKYRHHAKHLKKYIVASYFLFSLVMSRPVYYLMDKIDFTGGSTGWHRARLIEQSLRYIHEWWLFGTDHTRHWMPTGVSWNPDHTDLTNYYLHIGVLGGLPLMLTLIFILMKAFDFTGRHNAIAQEEGRIDCAFAVWLISAALAAHVMSCISVSYFDQMFVLLYLLIALISNLHPFSSDRLIETFEEEHIEESERDLKPQAAVV